MKILELSSLEHLMAPEISKYCTKYQEDINLDIISFKQVEVGVR